MIGSTLRGAIAAVAVIALATGGCRGSNGATRTTTGAPAAVITTAEPSTTVPPPTTSTVPPTETKPAADWQAVASEYAAAMAGGMSHGGAIVAIWRNGALHAAADGDQPDGTSIPPDGAWRIGSVTKPFAATLVLQLVEQGRLDLDAPAATYLDRPVVPDSVTIRDLLAHTSGIFNYTDDISFFPESFADLERRWDPAALVASALELRDVPAEPEWSYSNTNYLVLGLIIEQVTGRPAGAAIADLAASVGLPSTYLAGAGTGLAPVGAFTLDPGEKMVVDTSFPYTSIASGAWTAGAMVSNAADLLHFVRTLFAGDLIGEASLAAMAATENTGYGLGIARIPGTRTEVFGHGGGIVGYSTHVAYAPQSDVGIVVGVTSDRPPSDFARLLQRLMIEVLAE